MDNYKLVMPQDMNPYGFLFGGKLLLWIDEVGWMAVNRDYPGMHFVTVGLSEVTFKKSVHPQSVLRFDTRRKRQGRTSVTYHIDVYRRHMEAQEEEAVFHTDITFVRLDPYGNKMEIGAAPCAARAEEEGSH